MPKSLSLSILESVRVASPCTADWDSMTGDDRVRHCSLCNLNVYNLSAMPADEAAALVQDTKGRRCIQLLRRADGTVMTQDCPVGLRAIRVKAARAMTRIGAAAALLLSGGIALGTGSRDNRPARLGSMQPFATIRNWLSPTPPRTMPIRGELMLGKMAAPRPPKPRSNP
jgi:hypothetical protein